MKNVFIGLLVVAAGAGVYFFVLKKKQKETKATINKEWVIGKWKASTAKDSAFNSYQYNFLKDGSVLRSVSDTVKADTLYYEWSKANELVWKEKASDSTGKIFAVIKQTSDSLQLQSTDSLVILFTKLK